MPERLVVVLKVTRAGVRRFLSFRNRLNEFRRIAGVDQVTSLIENLPD